MGTITLVGVVQANAETTSGWSGGSLESELAYQGSASYGGKVASGTTRYPHTGTARNFSVGGGNEGDHIIVILGSLTPGKLDSKANGGLGILAGNDGTNFGEWYVDGSDTKSPTTLFLPYIIDPASDFDNALGSFTLSGNPAQLNAADYFGGRFDATSGIMGNFNNGLVDQITIGTGLRGTGTGGALAEWVTADEGTVGNRFGFLTTREGVLYFQGKMYFGSSGSSYVFSDSDKVIIFPDVKVAADFYEIIVENASSVVTFDGFTLQAPGTPKFALTHFSGEWDIANSTIDGARAINGGAGLTISGSKISNSGQVSLGGMILTDCTVTGSTASSAVLAASPTEMNNVNNTGLASSNGHGVELIAPGTYTFTSIGFTGGGGAETVTSDVYNNSGGAVTLNIVGGDTPTVRNGTGASTVVNNAVDITLTGIISGSRVHIRDMTNSTDLFNQIEASSSFSGSVNYTGDVTLRIRVRNASGTPKYKALEVSETLTSVGLTRSINQILDE
jgi:hypothetical protein